jgi:MoxR-like ATPase
MQIEQEINYYKKRLEELKHEIRKVIIGHEEVIDQIIISIVAGGHVLLEGVPGIGKTLLVKTLSQCLDLKFSRIQFTPDLMPADITGTNIIVEDKDGRKYFQFQPGPIFGNIILADEINRATPKTQSALLEAMQELTVTVGGVKHNLQEPFFVLATQNPIEMEGTFPLPEAQIDRFFFKVLIFSPPLDELMQIVDKTTTDVMPRVKPVLSGEELLKIRALVRQILIASHVNEFIGRIVLATHPDSKYGSKIAKKYIRYGASPRGGQALALSSKVLALMKGRYNICFDDVKDVVNPSLRHRIILNFEAQAEGVNQDFILSEILKEIEY